MHAHFGTNGAEIALLAHLISRIPYSFTVHGPEEFDKPEYLGLREKIRHASFVCAISSYGRGQLYRWVPYEHWSKIKIVRCGLDKRFIMPSPQAAIPSHSFVCVGRLCEQKGQLLLVEAVARLASEGLPIEIVFAGDGELRNEVERRADELGVRDKISITGWISAADVREQILGARALVLPSFAEGIPVVLMEAMALERAVVTTYVGGIPELVVDGETGWLLPAGSVDDLVTALRDCINCPSERMAEMGRNGRLRVLELHDINRECTKLAELIGQNRVESRTAHTDIPLSSADPSADDIIAPKHNRSRR